MMCQKYQNAEEKKRRTNRLTKTLNKVKQTNEYRRYALNKTRDEISEGKAKRLTKKNCYPKEVES